MARYLGLLLAGLISLGCGQGAKNEKSDKGGEGQKKYRIAVIPKGTTHEFWKSVHYGAEKAAEEFGNVEILWKGAQLENDREGQIGVVQDFITSKVDGICLAPLDSQALVPYVKEAHQADIPVVIFDSGLTDESLIVSYVATDNRNGGNLAAKELAKALGGKGNVILLRYNVGSESTEQREEGFLETLRNEFPEIKILVDGEYAGTTPELALNKAVDVLSIHKADVNGIFAVCEPNGTGVLKALEEQKLAGKVKFITFDPSPELVAAMKEDKIHGIVLQDPVKMGYESVKAMVNHLERKEVKKRIVTGEHVATPENMEEPRMKELLNPERFGE